MAYTIYPYLKQEIRKQNKTNHIVLFMIIFAYNRPKKIDLLSWIRYLFFSYIGDKSLGDILENLITHAGRQLSDEIHTYLLKAGKNSKN